MWDRKKPDQCVALQKLHHLARCQINTRRREQSEDESERERERGSSRGALECEGTADLILVGQVIRRGALGAVGLDDRGKVVG